MTIREIISACGGPEAISAASRKMNRHDWVASKSVYNWFAIGIPEKRWPVIRKLTDVTEAELHAANEALRRSKKKADRMEVSAA